MSQRLVPTRDCLCYLEFLWFHTNFWIFLIYVKISLDFLIETALNLQMALGSMDILTMLFLLILEHGLSLHLSVSSISFINAL